MKSFLSVTNLEVLRALVGSTFKYVGGLWLPDFLVSSSVTLVTTAGPVTLRGDLIESSFEGFEDEYSYLALEPTSMADVDKIQASGNTYLRQHEEQIKSISVIREDITEQKSSVSTWTYSKDIAIVFELESVCLIFELISHGSETLRVKIVKRFKLSEIDLPVEHWDEDLLTSYVRELAMFNLNSAKLHESYD